MNAANNDQPITQKELVDIVNNTDKKYTYDLRDYILIIKDQPNRPCTLYVTDCEQAIWSKIVDVNFFVELRNEIHLTSAIQLFAAHFVNSITNSSQLVKQKSVLKLQINLMIGDGIKVNCSTKIQSRIHFNNPDQFKRALRKFMVNLHQVKCSQITKIKNNFHQQKKQQLQKLKFQKEAEQIKPQFAGNRSASKNVFKKRSKADLVNPEKKKRLGSGARLRAGQEQIVVRALDVQRLDDDDEF